MVWKDLKSCNIVKLYQLRILEQGMSRHMYLEKPLYTREQDGNPWLKQGQWEKPEEQNTHFLS